MCAVSQGNFFEIQSLARLAQEGNAPTDLDAACVGMVPTASPTSVGYPMSSLRLQPVQVLGDIVLNSPFPTFPAVSTPLFVSLLGDSAAARAAAAGQSPSYFPATLWLWDQLKMHEFRGSYLSTVGARSLVQQAITDIYANCEIALTVGANPLLPVGSTEQLSASITGADGRAITPLVPIAWQSSDTAVAGIDANGVLTGVAEGTTRVTASYRGQHADQIVEVFSTGPDASLTVVVQNTSLDVPPFWLDRPNQVWRRRDIVVSVTPNDSLTTVASVVANGMDIYGEFRNFDVPLSPPAQDGSLTTVATGLFFDNPRTSGVPVRFSTGRLWIMTDDVWVRIVTIRNGQPTVHWVRAPLANP